MWIGSSLLFVSDSYLECSSRSSWPLASLHAEHQLGPLSALGSHLPGALLWGFVVGMFCSFFLDWCYSLGKALLSPWPDLAQGKDSWISVFAAHYVHLQIRHPGWGLGDTVVRCRSLPYLRGQCFSHTLVAWVDLEKDVIFWKKTDASSRGGDIGTGSQDKRCSWYENCIVLGETTGKWSHTHFSWEDCMVALSQALSCFNGFRSCGPPTNTLLRFIFFPQVLLKTLLSLGSFTDGCCFYKSWCPIRYLPFGLTSLFFWRYDLSQY